MLQDLEQFSEDTVIQTDVCIIGTGAAGITIAREMLGRPDQVVVLEGGGRTIEPASQDTYKSRLTGLVSQGIHDGRARAFGGTTLLWAGQSLPFFDIDFEQRDWVANSGWPINRAELSPFYHRAEQVMQIDHLGYGLTDWPSAHPPTYDPEQLVSLFSQFAAEPSFAAKYGAELENATNVRVILHANVTNIDVSEGAETAQEVLAVSLNGRRLRVQPRYVIICAGSIETARCLLLSDAVEPNGIGNKHDVVGRFFQDHPTINVAVRPRNKKRFDNWCNSFKRGSTRFTLKIAPSDHTMRCQRIQHVGSEVYYPPDPVDSLNAAKAILRGLKDRHQRDQILPSLGVVARDPMKVLAAAYAYYIRRQPASVGLTAPRLGFFCEQQPDPQSRVTLDREVDRLGMRRISLDWRMNEGEITAVRVLGDLIQQEWQRLDVADLDIEQLPRRDCGDFSAFQDNSHQMGTCRMGTNPRTSVVDPHCRVHGYDNLYIASSATFPTGGFSNPTLTIIALSLRIADEIKTRLNNSTVSSCA